MKFTRDFLYEKTGLRIDQPTSDGGTTSTGNIARQFFLNKNFHGQLPRFLII